MKLSYTPVTLKNLKLAVNTAVRALGEEDRASIRDAFSQAARPEKNIRAEDPSYFFIASAKGQPVGVTGHYYFHEHPGDAWLGWMGVVPEARGHGLGESLVRTAFRMVKDQAFSRFRIWTTTEPAYDAARALYKKMGFTEEPYRDGATDGASMIVVCSKAVRIEANNNFRWKDAPPYPIDCDRVTIPELNKKFKLG